MEEVCTVFQTSHGNRRRTAKIIAKAFAEQYHNIAGIGTAIKGGYEIFLETFI